MNRDIEQGKLKHALSHVAKAQIGAAVEELRQERISFGEYAWRCTVAIADDRAQCKSACCSSNRRVA